MVQRNDFIHRLQRQEAVAAIRDVVKTVASSQHLQSVLFLDISRYLLKRVSRVQLVCAVFEIARPVRQLILCRPTHERRHNTTRRHSTNQLDKCPLFQGWSPFGIDIYLRGNFSP